MRTTAILTLLVTCLCAQAALAQTILSQSTDGMTVTTGNSASCNAGGFHTDNFYYRAYNIAANATVTAIRFGVEEDTGGPNPLILRLYTTSVVTGTPTLASLTPLGTTTTTFTPGNNTWGVGATPALPIVTVNLQSPVNIASGTRVVVELQTPNNQAAGGSFFIGSNASGQAAPCYIYAGGACGLTNITDVATIGFPMMHVILDLVTFPSGAPNPEIDVQRLNQGPGRSIPSGTTGFEVGSFVPGMASNVTFTVANQGTSTALTPTVAISGTTNVSAGTPTLSASIAAGATATLTIPITPAAGVGTFAFTVTITSNDADEGMYTIACIGGRGFTGTVTVIPAGGGTYTDLGVCFNDIEDFGLAGNVIVELAAGTYVPTSSFELGSDWSTLGNADIVQVSNPANTLTIRAATGATVNIDGTSSLMFDGIIGAEAGCLSIVGISNLTIERLNFINGAFGLLIGTNAVLGTKASNATIRQCTATGATLGPGISVFGQGFAYNGAVIENCMIRGCAAGNSALYGTNFWPGALSFFFPGAGTIVRHCTVANDAGLVTTGQQGAPGAVGWRGPKIFTIPPELTFNIFTSSTNTFPIYHLTGTTTAAPTAPESPTVADRNVYFLSGGAIFAIESAASPVPRADFTAWRVQYPTIDAASLSQDPLFVGATNLHINTGSPAIDLATTSTTNIDIDGDTRPSGAQRDSGADENTGGGGAPEMDVTRGATVVVDGTTDNVGTAFTQGIASNLTYTFANTGTANLTLTNPATIGSLTNCTATITTPPTTPVTPSNNTTTTISVTPTTAAAFSFTYSIANNDSNENPYNWTVSGTASATAAPEMDVTRGATAITDGGNDAIGNVAIGTPTTATYTITNSGTANLTLTTPVGAPTGQTNCTASVTTQPTSPVAASGTTNLVITYTVTAVGAFSFAVSVANNDANENPYNWTVNGAGTSGGGGLTITTASIPNGTVGTPYNATITATGGTGPFSWSISSGTLPAGLTLSGGTGTTTTITGTPTAATNFNFTVRVQDSLAAFDTQLYTGTISTSGGGGIGGGGGGGGCSSDADNAPWLMLAAIASLAVVFSRLRRKSA